MVAVMANVYREIEEHDIRRMLAHIPVELVELMKANRLVIAGGFCRSVIAREPIKDIDVFVIDVRHLSVNPATLAEKLMLTNPNHLRAEVSERAITVIGLKYPIQFIAHTMFAGVTKILDSFDFTINEAAVWYWENSWHGTCDRFFYEHLASKTLVPASLDHHGGNLMMRMLKFVSRGYTIPRNQLLQVMNQCYQQAAFEQAQLRLETGGDLSKGLEKTLNTNYEFIGKRRYNIDDFKEHIQGSILQSGICTATAQQQLKPTTSADYDT